MYDDYLSIKIVGYPAFLSKNCGLQFMLWKIQRFCRKSSSPCKFYVIHIKPVLTINMSSDKLRPCLINYDIHQFLHVSAPRCHPQGVILTKFYNSWFQSFAVFLMLYSFFWVIPRLMNFMCRRFGTLCSIFIGAVFLLTPLMKMEQTECSETSAHKIQTPGNHTKERI